jgi:hypothetical protein
MRRLTASGGELLKRRTRPGRDRLVIRRGRAAPGGLSLGELAALLEQDPEVVRAGRVTAVVGATPGGLSSRSPRCLSRTPRLCAPPA